MTVNSTRDFIPPEPFEGQNYKPRYARPSASLREELICKLIQLSASNLKLNFCSETVVSKCVNPFTPKI